jgi:putative pyruvate formate lyase activating enzyme
MYNCTLCPRLCSAPRDEKSGSGACRAPDCAVVARAAPHYGEEPCISGTRGSGTVFFSGCCLHCVFCQNFEISEDVSVGKRVSDSELREIILSLRDTGVHNISLVTPGHYHNAICRALDGVELGVPLVWNSSGYERAETLAALEGKVQVYLPDMKYSSPALAARYSAAPNYPEVAKAAITEMYRQVGPCVFDGDGILQRGVLIRHLMLPDALDNTLGVIDWVSEAFPRGSVLFSLMSQYTPPERDLSRFPELCGRVSRIDYDAAVSYMELCGIDFGFTQEPESATDELLPNFDGTGVDR